MRPRFTLHVRGNLSSGERRYLSAALLGVEIREQYQGL
jgi:hypothetical protein